MAQDKKCTVAWKAASRAVLLLVYIGVAINAGITIATLAGKYATPKEDDDTSAAALLAAVFVSIACPLTVHDVHMHVLHYRTRLQRHYIRILGMVFTYSLQSFCALKWPEYRVYLEAPREVYEAFAVYSFYKLLIEFLGPYDALVARLEGRLDPRVHELDDPDSVKPTGGGTSLFFWLRSPEHGAAAREELDDSPLRVHMSMPSTRRSFSSSSSALDLRAFDDDSKDGKGDAGRSSLIDDVRASPPPPASPAAAGRADVHTPLRHAAYGPARASPGSQDGSFPVGTLHTPLPASAPAPASAPVLSNAAALEAASLFGRLGGHAAGGARAGDNGASTLYARVPDGRATMLAPFCCLPRWKLAEPFLTRCTTGVLQYVVVRVITAIVTFVLQALGLYGDGEWALSRGYVYVVIVVNVSQLWALWCLAVFGYHLWAHLSPIRPLGKFAVIKWVVALSWWQSVILSILANSGALRPVLGLPEHDFAAGLQDLLITAEMALAALAHHFYFSYIDFKSHTALAQHVAAQRAASSSAPVDSSDAGANGDAPSGFRLLHTRSNGAIALTSHKSGIVAAFADMVPVDVVADSVQMVGQTASSIGGAVKTVISRRRATSSVPSAADVAAATESAQQEVLGGSAVVTTATKGRSKSRSQSDRSASPGEERLLVAPDV
jgi:hypothetical protein